MGNEAGGGVGNDVFKALGDPTRRRIVEILAQEGPLSAGDIASRFDISAPSISHHLALLRNAQLVADTRRGQSIVYSLNAPVLKAVAAWAAGLLGGGYSKLK